MNNEEHQIDIESLERAIEAYGRGKMVVLVDDKERENEGDLVIAAEHCGPDDINFMCRYGRGLICLALTPERVDALRLPMMVPTDPGDMGTAFTVSVEARRGVTTGISAADRAETVRVAADPVFTADDLVSPGHIFPLRSQPGGVLVRSGHTEGAVDLSRLAGCKPAGVICEIMRDDGEMARMDDLEVFAKEHDLPVLSIADLIEYRLGKEDLVEEVEHPPLASAVLGVNPDAGWSVRTWRSSVSPDTHYMTMSKGDLSDGGQEEPVLLRAQRANMLRDVFGFGDGAGSRVRSALSQIDRAGRGVFLYIIGQEAQDVRSLVGATGDEAGEGGLGLRPAEQGFRQFGLGAQVLRTLGLRRIRVLTNNPRRIIGLRGYGIEVAGTVPLEVQA
ncbi:MAG: 3,4-dihydroxy-2-butanone-4-phosphate synthase [Nannocystales bacterium]